MSENELVCLSDVDGPVMLSEKYGKGVVIIAKNGFAMLEWRNLKRTDYFNLCWEDGPECDAEDTLTCMDCAGAEWKEFEPC